MKHLYFICIFSILFSSCHYEDQRASDFSLSYDISYGLFSGKKVDGTIMNISSTPASSVTIKVDMNYKSRAPDFDYLEVNQLLYQNDVAGFCLSLDEEVQSVSLTITNVQ